MKLLAATLYRLKTFRLVFVLLLTCLSLTSCGSGARAAAPALAPTPTPEPEIRVSGSGSTMPLVEELARVYSAREPKAQFRFEKGTNTGGAIRGLAEGTLDLAVANRPLSKTETTDQIEYRPFGRDPLAFAVQQSSPATSLTTSQVRDIYSGKITDWNQLGGPAAPILVLDRDEDESSRKLGLIKLMEGNPVEARTIVLSKASEMIQAIDRTPGSLGYSQIGILRLQGRNLLVLGLDGVTPTAGSVARDTYPWFVTLALVHRRDAPAAVTRFVDYVLSAEGRQILERYDVSAP